jgi:D-alanyl-D-alanine carboxypeptidase
LKVDHSRWRKSSRSHNGTRICSCVIGAVSVFAITASVQPAAARHGPRHASHGVHERHARHDREQGNTPPYADIVLDVLSGKVLHADKADELRHPASLTKIMTLYLLFEKLEAGKLRLDSQLPVSEHASVQAPTKLGLKPGQTIEVEDAIRGLVTKSANDAAVTVAEAIGGSEHDFAEMMTAKAHALGMTHTIYRNASGLPNDEQVTTAHDQATLGRAIQERFPRYYKYFSTPSFTWNGETLRNHNHLLGRVEGMDGIKTGYTQASGFNLVASVRRSDRHIVSVVLGGSSAGARDARMRSLIEDYIDKATPQKNIMVAGIAATKADAARKEEARKEEARKEEARKDEARLNALVRSATAEPPPEAPRPKPADAAPKDAGPADAHPGNGTAAPGSGTYSVASAEPIKPIQVKTLRVKMAPAQVAALAPAAGALAATAPTTPAATPPAATETPQREPERDLIGEAIRATAREASVTAPTASPNATAPGTTASAANPGATAPVAASASPAAPNVTASAAPVASPPPASATPPVAHTGWMIQVGAFDIEHEAHQRLSVVQSKVGNLLKHASPFTEAVTSGDKTLYRARFAGIQKDQAEAICKQLKRNDIACMTIKN